MKFTNILVPVNEGDTGESAFRLACQLSKGSNAKLYALYVIEIKQEIPLDAEVDGTLGESILSRIETVGKKEKCKVKATMLQARHAGPAIVQEASDKEVSLIVLGISFKRQFNQFKLGDTASYLLRNAPCPIILWQDQTSVTSPTATNHQNRLITEV